MHEPMMGLHGAGFFGTLLIGLLAGWLAEKITDSDMGLFRNLLIGVAGAFVGSFLVELIGLRIGLMFRGWFWGNLIVATLGAVLLIALSRWWRSR